MGTNRIVGVEPEAIRKATFEVLGAPKVERRRPPLWDGRAGERIADVTLSRGS
jgi:UDP-N-acetylglucosamine 2-epimerase (non-hydrolysing)